MISPTSLLPSTTGKWRNRKACICSSRCSMMSSGWIVKIFLVIRSRASLGLPLTSSRDVPLIRALGGGGIRASTGRFAPRTDSMTSGSTLTVLSLASGSGSSSVVPAGAADVAVAGAADVAVAGAADVAVAGAADVAVAGAAGVSSSAPTVPLAAADWPSAGPAEGGRPPTRPTGATAAPSSGFASA